MVVPFFCGHGIGEYFHGPPSIIHVGKSIQLFVLDKHSLFKQWLSCWLIKESAYSIVVCNTHFGILQLFQRSGTN